MLCSSFSVMGDGMDVEQYLKFRNTLIGVLCSELSEGMELNKACENWNKRVDPINYKKASHENKISYSNRNMYWRIKL